MNFWRLDWLYYVLIFTLITKKNKNDIFKKRKWDGMAL